jgi:hypothetical protein
MPTFDERVARGDQLLQSPPQQEESFRTAGRNTSVGTAEIDVWSAGGMWLPPTAARIHDIACTNANDTAGGTGAQEITVFGLLTGDVSASEAVPLDGLNSVPTVNAYTMINSMRVSSSGSSNRNEGVITATAQVDGTVTAQIDALHGHTTAAIYKVPASKVLLIDRWYLSVNKSGGSAGSVDGSLCVYPPGEAWHVRNIGSTRTDGSSNHDHKFALAIAAIAGSFVKITAISSVMGGLDVDAGFEGKLVDALA